MTCPECGHPLDEHGPRGCMDSDHAGERDALGFCVCMNKPSAVIASLALIGTDAQSIELLRAVESYDAANQSDLPLPLLTSIRQHLGRPA